MAFPDVLGVSEEAIVWCCRCFRKLIPEAISSVVAEENSEFGTLEAAIWAEMRRCYCCSKFGGAGLKEYCALSESAKVSVFWESVVR